MTKHAAGHAAHQGTFERALAVTSHHDQINFRQLHGLSFGEWIEISFFTGSMNE
jgi:hypothetical protein